MHSYGVGRTVCSRCERIVFEREIAVLELWDETRRLIEAASDKSPPQWAAIYDEFVSRALACYESRKRGGYLGDRGSFVGDLLTYVPFANQRNARKVLKAAWDRLENRGVIQAVRGDFGNWLYAARG